MSAAEGSWRDASAGEVFLAVTAAAAVFLFYTSLDLYAYEAWGTPAPSIWMALFIVVALAACVLQPERLLRLVRSSAFLWLVGFFCLTSAWAVFAKDAPPVVQVIVERYRTIFFIVALLVLFDDPLARRFTSVALIIALLISILLNLADATALVPFAPNDDRVPGRAAGLYANANYSGLSIASGLAMATAAVRRRWRVPLLLCGAVAIALTFSRSSALAFSVLVLALVWTKTIHLSRFVLFCAVAAGVLMYFSDDLRQYLEAAGVLNENTWSRLRMTRDDSGRIAVARRAWDLLVSAPLVGNGIGSTVDWDVGLQTHNQYLNYGADHGLLGLLILPAAAWALAVRSRAAFAFAAVLLLAGFFTHGLFAERAVVLVFALAGASRPAEPEAEQEGEEERDDDLGWLLTTPRRASASALSSLRSRS